MPYGILQCYLPQGRADIPAFTSRKTGTQLVTLKGCNAELTQWAGVPANEIGSLTLPRACRLLF